MPLREQSRIKADTVASDPVTVPGRVNVCAECKRDNQPLSVMGLCDTCRPNRTPDPVPVDPPVIVGVSPASSVPFAALASEPRVRPLVPLWKRLRDAVRSNRVDARGEIDRISFELETLGARGTVAEEHRGDAYRAYCEVLKERDVALAEVEQLRKRAEKAEALRSQAVAYLETEMNNHLVTGDEIVQLRALLAEAKGRAEATQMHVSAHARSMETEATARVRDMREAVADKVRRYFLDLGYFGLADSVDVVIRAVPLDTGTAADTGEDAQAEAEPEAVTPAKGVK